jgi:cysteine desulfurase/selenocysteine lyase
MAPQSAFPKVTHMMRHQKFDAARIRDDFPALQKDVNGKLVTFLDSAASAQKPYQVIEAMSDVMHDHYANVHRGVYEFSQQTTLKFEDARRKVAGFLNAASEDEIIFTRNTTEAINLFAQSWGRQNLTADDEIILTTLEHHANIVPWHMLRAEIGFTIKIAPIHEDGAINMSAYRELLTEKTKLVSMIGMSNAIGTVLPVQQMTALAKQAGATVMIDATQSVVHMDVDVREIGCDFLAFTGHKLYGPTGIGVLYGRAELLEAMPPYQGGGEMIETVSFDEVTYKSAPARFEAGTPAIVEVIGLGAAIDYIQQFDKTDIQAHEKSLLDMATRGIEHIEGVHIHGTTADKASILSFTMEGIHPHDIGTIFDQMGIAVRAGHHCAQPLMKVLNVPATVRASFAIYNTEQDVERLIEAIHKVKAIFG